MNLSLNKIMIGVAAGFAAALLSIGLVMQTGLSFVLFMLSPLPIMLAGLGWGPASGMVSVAAFGGMIYFAANGVSALISMLVMAIPALVAVYWIAMARNDAEGRQEWFPLGVSIFLTAIASAVGTIFAGLLIGYGPTLAGELSLELVKQLAAASPEFASDPVSTISLANFLVRMMPMFYPAIWVAVLAANLWLALKISQRSNLFSRPSDDWPSALRMPQPALPLFALAMAGTFLSGGTRMVVDVFAGSFGMAFALAGLAYFHHITRGKSWRMAALWFGWLLPVLTGGLGAAAFLFAGLYASAKKTDITRKEL